MRKIGGRNPKGGRKRAQAYEKLYRKGEGSSFELKDKDGKGTGKWRGVITYRDTLGNQKRKSFSARSETEVRDKMKDWLASGGVKRKGEWTVTDLFEEMLSEVSDKYPKGGLFLQRRRQKPNTIFDYRSQWRRHIKPRIGNMKAGMVESHHIDQILADLQNDAKNAISYGTVRNIRTMLSSVFKAGARLRIVNTNPVKDSLAISVKRFKATIISLDAMRALETAAQGLPIRPGILLAGYCGLREAEIAGLMHTDFDSAANTLTIRQQYQQVKGGGQEFSDPKSKSGLRTIPLPTIVADALREIPKTSLYLFPHSKDPGKPMHPTMLYKATMAVIDAHGLTRLRFHDLRHSANNILKQLGVDSVTRRDILGHSTTAVTDNVYTQTVDAEMIDAVGRINKALGTPSKSVTKTR